MKLCEHIAPIYQNEIALGNEPVLVSTPGFVDKGASAHIYVHMKNPIAHYDAPFIEYTTTTTPYFPHERMCFCSKCKHYLSGPFVAEQKEKFVRQKHHKICQEIIADRDNIYIQDGFYGKGLIPVDKWKT